MKILDCSSIVTELISKVGGLDSKAGTFLSRVEGSYNLVEDLPRRAYSTVRMLPMVLRLLRKLPKSFGYEEPIFLIRIQPKTIQCLGHGL